MNPFVIPLFTLETKISFVKQKHYSFCISNNEWVTLTYCKEFIFEKKIVIYCFNFWSRFN